MAKRLPTPTDPCGQVHYSFLDDSTEHQYLGRADFQRTSDDTIFGRYMATKFDKPIPMREGDSALSLYDAANNRNVLGMDALSHSLVLGDTRVFGPNTVNSAAVLLQPIGRVPPGAGDVRPVRHRLRRLRLSARHDGGDRHGQRLPGEQSGSEPLHHRRVADQQRPHAGARQSSAGGRRQRRLLEVLVPVARAIGRELDVPRPADRPRAGGLPHGPRRPAGARRAGAAADGLSGTSGPTRRTPGGSLRG